MGFAIVLRDIEDMEEAGELGTEVAAISGRAIDEVKLEGVLEENGKRLTAARLIVRAGILRCGRVGDAEFIST